MPTALEKLNQLLSKVDTIPQYRRIVSKSGSNFAWLKKHLVPELITDINLPMEEEQKFKISVEEKRVLIALLNLHISSLSSVFNET